MGRHQRDEVELLQQQEERRARGERLTRADEVVRMLMRFEVELTTARLHREHAGRHGLVHDDSYDRTLLSMEAAVIDLCKQLLDVDLAGGNFADAGEVVDRLHRGLASVRAERDIAIATGWSHNRERKILATREIEWERAVRKAERIARRG